jgi:hypothetical protein
MLLYYQPRGGLKLVSPAILLNYIPTKGISVWGLRRHLKSSGRETFIGTCISPKDVIDG